MVQMQLAEVEIGKVRPSTIWSNERQTYIEIDHRRVFVEKLSDKKMSYSRTGGGTVLQTLFYRTSDIPESDVYHQNYMEYLKKCWNDHLGIIVTPDILWYTLTCELASLVKSDAEKYRHLFSEHDEKQEIIVLTGDAIVLPLNMLIAALKSVVPTDTDMFLPKFSTSTDRSRHALHSAFADMASPFYNYSMMCGFPAIDVRGSEEDYCLLIEKWRSIKNLFTSRWLKRNPHAEWFKRVEGILEKCVSRMHDREWWLDIFRLEKCGSGSDVDVYGWFTELFLEKPKVLYPENFSPCLSSVEYLNRDTGRTYKMQDGLLFSNMDGDFLVPDFGFVVHEKLEIEPEPFAGYSDQDEAVQRLFARSKEI